jgi:hypothetical protein
MYITAFGSSSQYSEGGNASCLLPDKEGENPKDWMA